MPNDKVNYWKKRCEDVLDSLARVTDPELQKVYDWSKFVSLDKLPEIKKQIELLAASYLRLKLLVRESVYKENESKSEV